jgi:plasmid maintenance system antidote protein VapI
MERKRQPVKEQRLTIIKDLIEGGYLKTFQDIFTHVTKTEVAKELGINYTRFLNLIEDPKKMRYEETYSLAGYLKVPAKEISNLIHAQIDAKKRQK